MNSGPIILIDDDADDKSIFEDALRDLQIRNKLLWFHNCRQAFEYLKSTPEQPFVIICDINMQMQNGLEFKRQIDADAQLRAKSIPFIFYSTSADPATVAAAYTELTVQGFFQKKTDFDQIKKEVKLILEILVLLPASEFNLGVTASSKNSSGTSQITEPLPLVAK